MLPGNRPLLARCCSAFSLANSKFRAGPELTRRIGEWRRVCPPPGSFDQVHEAMVRVQRRLSPPPTHGDDAATVTRLTDFRDRLLQLEARRSGKRNAKRDDRRGPCGVSACGLRGGWRLGGSLGPCRERLSSRCPRYRGHGHIGFVGSVPRAIGVDRATWCFNACSARSAPRRNNDAYSTRHTANGTSRNASVKWMFDEQLAASVLHVAEEVRRRLVTFGRVLGRL